MPVLLRSRSHALVGLVLLLNVTNAQAGSVTGEVTFSGAPPPLPPVKVSKDQDYCGEILPNEIYLTDSSGGLRNVVVFIEGAPGVKGNPRRENTLENIGCRYSPRVMAMQKGERLRLKNNDPKLHIPHSYIEEKTVFNVSLPFRGTTIDTTQKIRQAGILKVVCDTHAWMLAYIHVFDHPYFAMTDEHGAFAIANLPAGTYILKAWHENGGLKSQEIIVPESGDVRVGFDFTQR